MVKIAIPKAILLLFAVAFSTGAVGALTVAQVQGPGHRSPYHRQRVEDLEVVVTAIESLNGFYVQSLEPDDDERTSEGLFVRTRLTQNVQIGDTLLLGGRVNETPPAGSGPGSLTNTILTTPRYEITGQMDQLPPPILISNSLGGGGRVPPSSVFSATETGNAEDGDFSMDEAMDFFESLEFMRVQVNDPLVVGSIHTAFGEFQVLSDRGRGVEGLNPRGGLTIAPDDMHPERISVDVIQAPAPLPIDPTPMPVIGDRFDGVITGVMTHTYNWYKIYPTETLPPLVPGRVPREVSSLPAPGPREFSVATMNLFNFNPKDPVAKAQDFAQTIVSSLGSPMVIALQEVQDDSGPTNDGVVQAVQGPQMIIDQIELLDPSRSYRYAEVVPENNGNGGEPGGNIRNGFLVRSDVRIIGSAYEVAPGEPAFSGSRPAVALDLSVDGEELTVVSVHFSSKSTDGKLFGVNQPPILNSEGRRIRQAEAVTAWVRGRLEQNPDAALVVAGDFNDFWFSPPLERLYDVSMVDLVSTLLPPEERYTYVYEGNSQDLDHILVSPALAKSAQVDVVHRYAEYLYGERHTDHDPIVAVVGLE